MNDEASRQTITACNLRFPGQTTSERAAFDEQFGARRAMNRAIDTTTAEERRVRRVHNGIDVQFSDVALDDLDSAVGILHRHLNILVSFVIRDSSFVIVNGMIELAFVIRISPFLRPLDIGHSSFLMARADQFATIRPPAPCTETGRASGWGGPAKIL